MSEAVEIQETVEIQAPPGEVFALIVHPERRLQLHPNWGLFRPQNFSADFPNAGSSFRMEFPLEETPPVTVTVTAYDPDRLFAYRISDARLTEAEWALAPAESGTHLVYRERFQPGIEPEPEAQVESDELFGPQDLSPEGTARQEARLWLDSLKRYAELRDGKGKLALKALIDRFILTLRGDQRRIILGLIAFQVIMCLTFLCAALGVGAARMVF